MIESGEPGSQEGHAEAVRVPRRLKRRRYEVNANQLFEWRKQYREGRLGHDKPAARPALPAIREPGLIRIGVIDHEGEVRPLPATAEPSALPSLPPPMEAAVPQHGSAAIAGRIEIELPNGIKVRVDGEVSERALTVALVAAKELV
jgi:transposase-like protein